MNALRGFIDPELLGQWHNLIGLHWLYGSEKRSRSFVGDRSSEETNHYL